MIDAVRFSGSLGVVGVFLPTDPGGAEAQGELAAQGKVALDYGLMWFKGQKMGTGQAPVKRYNRALRDLIAGGKAEPSFLASHELDLDQASTAYEKFDAREDGWTRSSSTRTAPPPDNQVKITQRAGPAQPTAATLA